MTKKEINKAKLKAIFAALDFHFTIEEDFEDNEGHGYFEGIINYAHKTFNVHLNRNRFDVIVYQNQNEDKKLCSEIEDEMETIIEQALADVERDIMFANINAGLGLDK